MNAPPLLVTFENLPNGFRDFIQSLPAADGVVRYTELTTLLERRLPPVTSTSCLSALFGVSVRLIAAMAARPDKYYRVFHIRNGRKKRQIEAPRIALKVIQKWLGEHIARAVVLPPYVHGFVPGRSCTTAARSHLGAHWLHTLDIENFFPSVTRDVVTGVFTELGYSADSARLLANLCTISGRLSQGSPASPVIANLAFRETDEKLQQLATAMDATYTRYADDIAFSGKGKPNLVLLAQVAAIISSARWRIATRKSTFQYAQTGLRLLGLNIGADSIRLPKTYRKRIRMMRFALEHKNLDEATSARYRGHVSYAASVLDSY